MRIDLLPIISSPVMGGMMVIRRGVCSIVLRHAWKNIDVHRAKLAHREYRLEIRWPFLLQLQLLVMRYAVGDYHRRHIDWIAPGERQFRIQFVLENARRGGELLCDHFVVSRRRFKIFEPCVYGHEVTKVEEGRRVLLNLSVRWSLRKIRPCPF